MYRVVSMDKKTEEMLNLIEKYNIDKIRYRFSKKFKMHKFLSVLKNLLLRKNINSLQDYILGIRLRKYEEKYPVENVSLRPVLDKKIVVYTCIVGDYDSIKEPIYFNDNVNYILFSDRDVKSSFWKVKRIPKRVLKLNDKTLINRYFKFHPSEFFKEYDYSIYIDGNVKTLTDISGFVDCVNNRTGLAMFKHHSRKCIYVEKKACLLQKKGNKDKIINQIEKYRAIGFPKNFGLLEGTIVVSDLKNNSAKRLLLDWWSEFLDSGSFRDQLSLPYVLWKNNYTVNDIGFLGNNARACPKLLILSHDNKTS